MTNHGKKPASQGTDGLIASYARWRSGSLGQITEALEQQLLVELLGPIAGKRLLDVGCGDGAFAVRLAQQHAVVTGLDPNPTMLAAARQRAVTANVPLRLVEGKVEALPFPDAAFDCVLAVAALCFVADAERAIAEMTRVLKPGGLLIIGELGKRSLWAAYRRLRGWLGHPVWRAARFRSPAELRRLMSQAGLDVLEIRGAVYYPPCEAAAQLLAPVDPWLGRWTNLGAAFIALSAAKPALFPKPGDAAPSLRREALPSKPGLNFPFYGAQVEMVIGVASSPRLLALAQQRAADAGVMAELIEGTASAIPLADRSIDTIVMTWTLCSVPDPLLALSERAGATTSRRYFSSCA